MAYLDTSILGSYYCPEPLSAAANAAVGATTDPTISELVELEFRSLLSLKVRTGDMNRTMANSVLAQFQTHLTEGRYRLVIMGSAEFELARGWLARFDTPLRALDALHLAAAQSNRQEIFTTDKLMDRAARQLGVKCRLVR